MASVEGAGESFSLEAEYLCHGRRPVLMAVACTVGIPAKPTPKGNFTIYSKQEHKRSGSYGFRVQGNSVVPAEGQARIFPAVMLVIRWDTGANSRPLMDFIRALFIPIRARMAAFVCMVRRRRNFYALVRIGTPVNIATTQPEDATIGPKVQRVDDSKAPDPDPRIMVTAAAFQKPSGPLLE